MRRKLLLLILLSKSYLEQQYDGVDRSISWALINEATAKSKPLPQWVYLIADIVRPTYIPQVWQSFCFENKWGRVIQNISNLV